MKKSNSNYKLEWIRTALEIIFLVSFIIFRVSRYIPGVSGGIMQYAGICLCLTTGLVRAVWAICDAVKSKKSSALRSGGNMV